MSESSGRTSGSWWLVRLFVASLVTLAGIQHSKLYGPLTSRPGPDDVYYFMDGLIRLRVLYNEGLAFAVHSFMANPPHAPFSSLLAALSFAILGRHDWAPYAGNGLIVLALLWAIDWAMGPARPWQRLGAYAFVLSSRLPYAMIEQFRPDFAWGLTTAFASLFMLRRPLVAADLSRKLLAGGIFGIALLIKPSVFPFTLGMLGLCLGLASAVDWYQMRGHRLTGAAVVRTWLACGATAVGISLAYFAFGAGQMWDYLHDALVSVHSDIWAFNGGKIATFRYFYDGLGGTYCVGAIHMYLMTAVVIGGAAWMLARRRGTRDNWRIERAACMLVAMGAAYAVPTIEKVKNAYFGYAFQSMLALGCVLMLRELLRGNEIPPAEAAPVATTAARGTPIAADAAQPPTPSAANIPAGAGAGIRWPHYWTAGTVWFALIVAASVCTFQAPAVFADANWPQTIATNRLLDQIYSTIHSRTDNATVFIPVPGTSVGDDKMKYLNLLDNSALDFTQMDLSLWNDPVQMRQKLQRANFVVVGDPGNDEVLAWLPGGTDAALQYYIDQVKTRDDLVEIARFPTANGKFYHVFAERNPAFCGWSSVSGMKAPEGPYPQWNLPVIRYGLGPESRLAINDLAGGHKTLTMICCSHERNQSMVVLLDETELGRLVFPPEPGDQFQRLDYNLDLTPGNHEIEIRYAVSEPSKPKYAVLFRTIQVLP